MSKQIHDILRQFGARQGECMSMRHKGVEGVDEFVRLTVSRNIGPCPITMMPSCRRA